MALYNDTWHLYDGIKSPNFLPCTEHFEAVYRPTYCLYGMVYIYINVIKYLLKIISCIISYILFEIYVNLFYSSALTNSHSETQKLQEPNTNGVVDCSDTDMLKAAMILETLSEETRGKKI